MPRDPHFPANLLVNADDFGLHPSVSLGIWRCLEEGLIDSFSVMPFTDRFHEDLLQAILKRHPLAKVGAHLCLLPALSPSPGHGGYGDDPGHYRRVLRDWLRGRLTPARVEAEWERQILALGRHLGGTERITHLDSHQHVHMLPGFWRAAEELRARFAIPRLRIPYEGVRFSWARKFPFGMCLQAAAWLRWRAGGATGAKLIGFASSTAFTVEANLDQLREVREQPGRRFELMVHPADPRASLDGEGGERFDHGRQGVGPEPSQAAEIGELRKLRDLFREGRL